METFTKLNSYYKVKLEQTLFSPLFYVMHYGPKDFSINKKDVISYIHELPDPTWREPSPTDPLSLIDQVKISLVGK